MVLFVLVYFSSCGKDSVKNMDTEPNNSIEEAVLLELDTVPFSTKIQEIGDNDWFKVEIPSQGYFAISASNMPEGINAEVKFALYEEWQGSKQKDISGWLEFPAVIHFPKAGTYYFVLHDDYDDASSKEPINIKIQYTEEFDKFEMNNDIETAQITSLNKTFEFYLYPNGDYDYFKIDAPKKNGYIKMMIKENYDDINPEIKFFKYDEWSDDKVSDLTGWLEFPAAFLIPAEGDIYFAIHDDYNDASGTEPYTLKIEFVDQMDSNEVNNTFKEATDLARGDTLSLAIFPKGDNDWYKITIADGETLEFLSKDWDGAIKPEIKLHTLNDKNELSDYSGWEEFPHSFNVTIGTTYYICIKDDYDDAAAEKAFVVVVK